MPQGIQRPQRHSKARTLALCTLMGLGATAAALPLAETTAAVTQDDAGLSVQLPSAGQVSPKVTVLVTLSPSDARPGSKVTLSAKAIIAPGWHIASLDTASDDAPSLPTTLEFEPMGLTPLAKTFTPSVSPEAVKVGKSTHHQHSGTVTWTREYRIDDDAAEFSGEGSIRFQVCNDEMCLPPKSLAFSLNSSPLNAAPEGQPAGSSAKAQPDHGYRLVGEPIVLALRDAKLSRRLLNPTAEVTADPDEDFDLYVKQITGAMNKREALPLCATVKVDGVDITIYLPDQEQYSLVNTTQDHTRFGNTATFLSIDHNADGKIVDYESVATNFPVRLADSMFLVTAISREERSLTLQGIDTPLAGAIVNRKCPEFWYETVDGHVISNKSILGTVTILDVWAVT